MLLGNSFYRSPSLLIFNVLTEGAASDCWMTPFCRVDMYIITPTMDNVFISRTNAEKRRGVSTAQALKVRSFHFSIIFVSVLDLIRLSTRGQLMLLVVHCMVRGTVGGAWLCTGGPELSLQVFCNVCVLC